ncbi:hypothetical protein [Streptomyces tsukubensis]|uniref:hypothetical protein n=1 Tax=Streptomyces tsukubensis TaxID=83656 RepID=UPI00344CAD58
MNATERREEPDEGCLYAVVRWPALVIAVIVMVPLRMLWELVKLICKGIRVLCWTWLLRPILEGLKILLWDWFLSPVLQFLARNVLVPIGNGITWVVERLRRPPFDFLIRHLLIKPGVLLCRWILAPVAFALIGALWFAGGVSAKVFNFLIARPLSWLWRALLVPVWNHLCVPIGQALRAILRPIGDAGREVFRAFRIERR